MRICSRCHQPCTDNFMFCDACWALLSGKEQQRKPAPAKQRRTSSDFVEIDTLPQPAAEEQQDFFTAQPPGGVPLLELSPIPSSHGEARLSREEFISTPTAPQPLSPIQNIITAFTDRIDNTLNRLSDAARHIAAEDGSHGQRTPRASRLSPLRDISADIRRDSTPLPHIDYNTQPMPALQRSSVSRKLALLWPWLQTTEEEEQDIWSDHPDPLQARHFPTHSEVRRIEVDDVRYAVETGWMPPPPPDTQPLPDDNNKHKHRRLRVIFACIAVAAALAITIDSVLLSFTVFHPNVPDQKIVKTGPTLTLSKNVVKYGEAVTLAVHNFSAQAQLLFTRDIAIPVVTNRGKALVQPDKTGSASLTTTIQNDWGPGFHTISVEDAITRYIANATLRVDAGPTRPAQLHIAQTDIDLGANIQGANTIQPLTLQNDGDESITWSATSDQPWLGISPAHGVFSDMQKISIGGTRTNLAPGDYTGLITITSNVSSPQTIMVHMMVRALPSDVGAVMAISPAVLSFLATDGGTDPDAQTLVVSNPGKQPLYWTLGDSTASTAPGSQSPNAALAAFDPNFNWLATDTTSGRVEPGATASIRITAHSHYVLPGTYSRQLLFNSADGHKALNAPQSIEVSLTVQPGCGLAVNSGSLTFTAVAKKDNPGSQSINLSTSGGCDGKTKMQWNAASSDPWLVINQTSGVFNGTDSANLTVSVNVAILSPGSYQGEITVTGVGLTSKSTQTIAVLLTVQSPPSPQAPVIGASPLTLNFTTTTGQADPPAQSVTITNTGSSPLHWHTNVTQFANSWLGATPSGGIVQPNQQGQLVVSVSANGLAAGSYSGQISLEGSDGKNGAASGSPQAIAITFKVNDACKLSPPSNTLLGFRGVQGSANPNPQTFTLTATGNCNWPVYWSTTVNATDAWIKVSPASGTFTNSGQVATVSVAPNTADLSSGLHRGQVAISATDVSGQSVQGGSSVVNVSINLSQRCGITVSPTGLNFSVMQGQTSAAQTLAISTAGACVLPANWTTTTDASSAGWLSISPTSRVVNGGSSSISVSANASQLSPNTYSGTITFTAADTNGVNSAGPQSIAVVLVVSGATVHGTVTACTSTICDKSAPLAAASVALKNSSGAIVMNGTADGSGNYSFSNVPQGSYTLTATGTDTQHASYTGSATVAVVGDRTVNINTFTAATATPTPTH